MVTKEYIASLLIYDPLTGLFTWTDTGPGRRKNKRAGTPNKKEGYIVFCINGKNYRANRLAWLFLYGKMPPTDELIDHQNGDQSDNSATNFRLVNNQGNQQNRKVGRNNTSGHIGVTWSEKSRKWTASFKVDWRKLYLGCFSKLDDAIKARKDAEILYGFHPNHGLRSK